MYYVVQLVKDDRTRNSWKAASDPLPRSIVEMSWVLRVSSRSLSVTSAEQVLRGGMARRLSGDRDRDRDVASGACDLGMAAYRRMSILPWERVGSNIFNIIGADDVFTRIQQTNISHGVMLWRRCCCLLQFTGRTPHTLQRERGRWWLYVVYGLVIGGDLGGLHGLARCMETQASGQPEAVPRKRGAVSVRALGWG